MARSGETVAEPPTGIGATGLKIGAPRPYETSEACDDPEAASRAHGNILLMKPAIVCHLTAAPGSTDIVGLVRQSRRELEQAVDPRTPLEGHQLKVAVDMAPRHGQLLL